MSDANTYLRPEYTPLFSQIQDYIAEALNSDPQISATGIKFYPEHILDIEFQIKENLGKQGTVGIVNTLKGTYGGHNGTTQAWDIEAEIDIFENPSIRRAQMKKMGLSTGTTADLVDWVSESMCGPTSPTYGKFCAVRQQLGEDRGILVGKSIMKTYAIADVSGIVSSDSGWHIPYALWSDLSALSGQVMELSDIVISGIGGDYLPLSGGEMSGDISFQPNYNIYWGTPDGYDARINASTPGLTIYNDAEDQWRFKSSFMSESEYDVMRRMDLSSIEVPTKVSELSNDVGYITSAQVEPAEITYGDYLSGYALKAWFSNQMLPVLDIGFNQLPLKENAGHLYLVYNERLKTIFRVPYDWSLSSFQGTQFSPPVTLKYSWWPNLYVRVGHRPVNIVRGWGWNGTYNGNNYFIQTAESLSAGYDMPASATPTKFYEIVGTTSYSSKSITLTEDQLSIATYDGQTGVIECARLSAGTTSQYNTIPYIDEVVPYYNTSALSITVPYDYGFRLQTPNGTPLLETIDLNRTSIYSLSTGNVEIASNGYLVKYSGAGVDTTKLSAWDWIKTGETSIGSIISGEHNAILGEVSEDYVSFNWLIQQGYATSAQVESSLSNYLPLSGGQMTGSIGWDYGGMGGPTIYGPYNPQQLAFTTTYEPDEQKMVFLDFGRIEEASGQRTIAFVEDIDAVLGDISALIHAT